MKNIGKTTHHVKFITADSLAELEKSVDAFLNEETEGFEERASLEPGLSVYTHPTKGTLKFVKTGMLARAQIFAGREAPKEPYPEPARNRGDFVDATKAPGQMPTHPVCAQDVPSSVKA